MQLDALLSRTCPWLLGIGLENDIVLSSRIRLARNLVGFSFPIRAAQQERQAVQETVRDAAAEFFPQNEFGFADMQSLSPLDREFLFERQLISRELADSEQTGALLFDWNERYGIMINEKDHLQIFSMHSGFELQNVWEQTGRIETLLGSKLDFVFHEQYGFLTSGISNAGTGLKISVMLHLPALITVREIDKVCRSLQKTNLVVRGGYGEGSQPLGDLFQISNRTALGKSEEEFIDQMSELIPQVISFERQSRQYLLKNRREMIFDRCSRAAGVLRTAQTISRGETMLHISSLRLGIALGMMKEIDIQTINALSLHTQPAHIQKIAGRELEIGRQDRERAAYIRQKIGT